MRNLSGQGVVQGLNQGVDHLLSQGTEQDPCQLDALTSKMAGLQLVNSRNVFDGLPREQRRALLRAAKPKTAADQLLEKRLRRRFEQIDAVFWSVAKRHSRLNFMSYDTLLRNMLLEQEPDLLKQVPWTTDYILKGQRLKNPENFAMQQQLWDESVEAIAIQSRL